MDRTINGPAKDWLTAAEAAEWLGVDPRTFRSLLRRKVIPGGRRLAHKTLRWFWVDLVAVAHLLSIGHPVGEPLPPPRKKIPRNIESK